VSACEACAKERDGRRKRCKGCKKLVGECCWYDRTRECRPCQGDPQSPDEHLARIEKRRQVMVESFAKYEVVCLGVWDGDGGPVVKALDPSPWKTWRDWCAAIEEAADALGLALTPSSEPYQEFPYVPEEGVGDIKDDEYSIGALRALVGSAQGVTP